MKLIILFALLLFAGMKSYSQADTLYKDSIITIVDFDNYTVNGIPGVVRGKWELLINPLWSEKLTSINFGKYEVNHFWIGANDWFKISDGYREIIDIDYDYYYPYFEKHITTNAEEYKLFFEYDHSTFWSNVLQYNSTYEFSICYNFIDMPKISKPISIKAKYFGLKNQYSDSTVLYKSNDLCISDPNSFCIKLEKISGTKKSVYAYGYYLMSQPDSSKYEIVINAEDNQLNFSAINNRYYYKIKLGEIDIDTDRVYFPKSILSDRNILSKITFIKSNIEDSTTYQIKFISDTNPSANYERSILLRKKDFHLKKPVK